MSLVKAAEDLKGLANKFKAIVEVADALAKIGSVEQAEREAHIRKEKALAMAVEAEKSAADKLIGLEKAQDAIHAAIVKGEEAKALAELAAKKIVEDAKAHAAEVMKGADNKRQSVLDSIQAHKAELFTVMAEVSAAKDDLAKFKEEIESLKAKVSFFVKG